MALLRTNKLLFTVLTRLGLSKLNGTMLTEQSILPVLGEGNPLAGINGSNGILFGVGVKGVSDPLLNIAESLLQIVTAVLAASQVESAEELRNPDFMMKLKGDLLKQMLGELLPGYDPAIIDLEGGNFIVNRDSLRQFLFQLQTQAQAGAKVKSAA